MAREQRKEKPDDPASLPLFCPDCGMTMEAPHWFIARLNRAAREGHPLPCPVCSSRKSVNYWNKRGQFQVDYVEKERRRKERIDAYQKNYNEEWRDWKG